MGTMNMMMGFGFLAPQIMIMMSNMMNCSGTSRYKGVKRWLLGMRRRRKLSIVEVLGRWDMGMGGVVDMGDLGRWRWRWEFFTSSKIGGWRRRRGLIKRRNSGYYRWWWTWEIKSSFLFFFIFTTIVVVGVMPVREFHG